MSSRFLFILLLLVSPLSVAETKLSVGDLPPAYLGKDSLGHEVNLNDETGKVVVVTFWASWCGSCIRELPILEGIQREAGANNIKVVAVNYKESRRDYYKIQKQLSSLELTLTHDKRGIIGNQFGVNVIPNLFIIGRDGKLAFHKVGYDESAIGEIITVLNELLLSDTKNAVTSS